jgi:putative transposase
MGVRTGFIPDLDAKWRQWQSAPQAEWTIALEREAVIRPLAEQDRLTEAVVEEAAARLGLGRTTIYRLVSRYRKRPQTTSLLPLKRGRSSDTRLLEREREDLVAHCIEEFYLTAQRPSSAALLREIKRRCAEQQLRAPNYRTVRRRLEALDARKVVQKREGAKAARERFGPVKASGLHSLAPLDLVQIDHTLVDVIVVDQEHRLPIGRPWLTLAIDVASRMVAGFHVSLEPPSALAVSLVLTHAALLKDDWLADRELLNLDWPVAGMPKIIHLDNAKEFHSEALVRGCQEYSIQIEHRPLGQPHFGGHIERLIGTMMGAVHLLPGTTFSDVKQKGSYNADARSVLTLPELERWLALQIAGVYHLSVHSQLERAPLDAWREGIAKRKQPIRHPADSAEFFLDFLPAVPRLVQKDGIHFHKIRYWGSILSPWAGRLKEPLLVKYDPRNLSRVYVRDPNGKHWPIPYSDLGQPPIALWELLEARKRLRETGVRAETEQAIFKSIAEQRRIVKAAANTSRQRRRRERVPAMAVPSQPREEQESAPTEVNPYPVEVWGK